jgi:hypothetical protein
MSVKSFNALPRKPNRPCGAPNHWHFDLRFVSLEPTPSHILFLVQIESSYVHSERLPLCLSSTESGMIFFPETGKEAAHEVAKALIHSFVNSFGQTSTPAFAPWKLTTEDPHLAVAVADEFKRLGIREELHRIHVVRGRTLQVVKQAFDERWEDIKRQKGLSGFQAAAFITPDSITFHNFRPAAWVGNVDDDDTDKALAYVQRLTTARPITAETDPRNSGKNVMKEVQAVLTLMKNKSTDDARAEADAGNSEAAIDYALRYVPIHIFGFSHWNNARSLLPAQASIWHRLYPKPSALPNLSRQSLLEPQRNIRQQVCRPCPPHRLVHRRF